MVKKIALLTIFLFISLALFAGQAAAAGDDVFQSRPEDLPEKSGVYAIRGHPELKLRVFVHPDRNNKAGRPVPTPTPTPTLKCDLSDPDSKTISDVAGWYLPETFTYYLNSNSVPASVGPQYLATIASNGFTAWTTAISDHVSFTNTGTTTQNRARLDGRNIITWGRTSTGTLGITYVWSYTSGLVAEADTVMNNIYPWSWSNPDTWSGAVCAYTKSYDAQNILTHELGHWLGVDDNLTSNYENNTMYGYGDVEETKKDTLTSGDITAVQSIYP